MTGTLSTTELAERLTEVLQRVRDHGDRFVIEQDGKPIADIAPRALEGGGTLGELIDGLLELGDPDEDFATDVRAAIAAQGPVRVVDWPT